MNDSFINKKSRYVYTMLLCSVSVVFISTLTACGGSSANTNQVSENPIEAMEQSDIGLQGNIDLQGNSSASEPQGNSSASEPQGSSAEEGQPRNAIAISAARRHTLALMQDGTLWSWGTGFVGDGTTESRNRPVQIMEDVVFASAGHHHSFAITTDGDLWAWGGNEWGQLGDGTNEDRLSPTKILDDVVYAAMPSTVPNSHAGNGTRSYAIRADGSLWAWGANGRMDAAYVALGDNGMGNRNSPIQILENVTSVVPTYRGGFALANDGTLWGWYPSTTVFDGDEAIEIEAQLYPTPIMENVASLTDNFAITTNGELWTLEHEPVLVMDDVIGAGGECFAITTDGTLWAWGQNIIFRQWQVRPVLGDGTTVDRDTPVEIMENVVSIATDGSTAYAITTDGTLWGWGNDGAAYHTPILIGDGSILCEETFFENSHMWEFDDDAFGVRWLLDDDGGTGLRLSPVEILENVVDVAPTFFMLDHGEIRGFRTFALTECGSVWAWGVNDIGGQGDHGLLGDGTSELRPYPVRIIEGDL